MVGVNTEAATATTTPTTETTKTVTCTRCHKEFTAPIKNMKRLCPDCRMTSCACCGAKTPIIKFDGRKHYCDACKASADRISKGNNYSQCCDCGRMIVGHMGGKRFNGSSSKCCTACKRKRLTTTCPRCGKIYIRSTNVTPNSICNTCRDELDTGLAIFTQCGFCGEFVNVTSTLTNCPLCNKPVSPKTIICMVCHKPFTSTHSESMNKRPICDGCKADLKWKNRSENAKEYDRLIAEGWKEINVDDTTVLITDIDSEYKGTNDSDKECRICKRKFKPKKHSGSRQKTCGYCRLVNRCHECGFLYAHKDPRVEKYCSLSCCVASKNRIEKIGVNITNDSITTATITTATETAPALTALITNDNYHTFNSPGVWCKINSTTGKILDLMATTNIAIEYPKIVHRIKTSTQTKYLAFRTMEANGEKIVFRLIKLCSSYDEAISIESRVAIEWKPRFWSPMPGSQQDWWNEANTAGIIN